jgi:hypothetical protein
MEFWKVIDEFPNYSVSNFGNIKNNTTCKIMKTSIKAGYYNVSLTNNKKRRTLKIHRIVAKAFISNPENKSDVNHKDKNKLNNNLDNLEWNTRKENNIHRCQNITITTNKNKRISRLDKTSNNVLESYNSIQEAGEWAVKNGYTKNEHNGRNAIGNCLQGLSKSAYGFLWSCDDNNNDLDGEIWKEVIVENKYSDKKYFVSNLGRFKNNSGTIMNNYKINENGYIRVYIYNKTYLLHRLIAFVFLENPENKEQVNHIDGNKINNKVENLEWVTCSENNLHKHKIGLGNNYTRKIGQYDLDSNLIKEYPSIVAASLELNTSKTNIRGVLTNYRKTAKGFIWKYLD